MDLIAFGGVFLELVFGHIERLPGPGEEIFSDEFAISCGGAVTIATAARREKMAAGIASLLGDDLGSRVLWEHCQREGIDLSACTQVAGTTAGITVVINFAGDRAFLSHLPPRPTGEPTERERWIEVLERERPAWAYLHAGRNVVPFLRRAREIGTRVVVDLNLEAVDRNREELLECIEIADVFVPNDDELCRLTGLDLDEALAEVARWRTPTVVKRGGGGAVVVEAGRAETVTAGLREVVVRDRTGAGDSFAGAMIAALARGDTLLAAAASGNAAGSDAVARLGAVGEVEVAGLSVSSELRRALDVQVMAALGERVANGEEERG